MMNESLLSAAIDFVDKCFKEEAFELALDPLQKIVASHPESAGAQGKLGIVLYKLGRLNEAVGHLKILLS